MLPDLAAVRAQMTRHRAVIRPKFEMALNAFATELCGLPGVSSDQAERRIFYQS